jgi:hypothetical protein
MWSVLNFGKYKGKTLPQVILHDPDYFFWGVEKDVFNRTPFLEQATLLHHRARNIKLPKLNLREPRVKYMTDRGGKFLDFEFGEADTPSDKYEVSRSDRLDLSVPRQIMHYDKLGSRLLLRSFKQCFFERDVRLTKRVCEEFFENCDNFISGVGTLDADERLFASGLGKYDTGDCSPQMQRGSQRQAIAEPLRPSETTHGCLPPIEEESTLAWLFDDVEPPRAS